MSSIMQQQRSGSYRSRTLSPRPVNHTMDLDRKLDHLLEDLQVTLSEQAPSNTLNRKYGSQSHITSNRTPQGPTINITQDGTNYKGYKTAAAAQYSYNVSTENIPQQTTRYYQESPQTVQTNLTQLDTLLNDLKQVNMGSNNSIGTSSGSIGNNVVHKEYMITSSKNDTRSDYLPPQQVSQKIEYSTEGNYGDIRKYKQPPPGNYHSNNLSSKMSATSSEHIIPIESNLSHSTPSRSFVYKKLESSKKNLIEDRPITPLKQTTATNKFNATVTSKNTEFSPPPIRQCSTPNKKIFVYKEVTTKNVTAPQPQPPPKPQEPNQTTIIMKENTETKNVQQPPAVVHNPKTDIEIFEKTENIYQQQQQQQPLIPAPLPQKDNNIVYNFKSETHNNLTNNYINYANNNNLKNENQKPPPFPVDETVDGPPKKVDELMAKLGAEPPNNLFNAGFNARQVEIIHEKQFEEVRGKPKDKKSKNLNGPAVYYPPSGEIVTKREEVASYANGKGSIMRETEKYEYGADGRLKTERSSGAKMVPFCLPLCCGLPCSII